MDKNSYEYIMREIERGRITVIKTLDVEKKERKKDIKYIHERENEINRKHKKKII